MNRSKHHFSSRPFFKRSVSTRVFSGWYSKFLNNTWGVIASVFISGATIAVPALSEPALANSVFEEVIVTSDFRDTGLLKTPASITVFDSQTIAQRQARHLEHLLNLAPNVNFSSGASRGRFIQIRGIGERSQFIEPLNPSVGILVDGIDFPANVISPLSGFSCPPIKRNMVVLPIPLGPIMAVIFPLGMLILISS